MNREEILSKIRASWSKGSAKKQDEWSPENSAWGQCLPTAVLVKSLLGGDIMTKIVTVPDGTQYEHFYNRLSTGEEIDLTSVQYPVGSLIPQNGRKYSPPSQVRRLMVLLSIYLRKPT